MFSSAVSNECGSPSEMDLNGAVNQYIIFKLPPEKKISPDVWPSPPLEASEDANWL